MGVSRSGPLGGDSIFALGVMRWWMRVHNTVARVKNQHQIQRIEDYGSHFGVHRVRELYAKIVGYWNDAITGVNIRVAEQARYVCSHEEGVIVCVYRGAPLVKNDPNFLKDLFKREKSVASEAKLRSNTIE